MDIKLVKLISGIDIITRIDEDNNNVWHYPMVIHSVQSPRQGMVHSLQSFAPHSNDTIEKIEIGNSSMVLFSYEPDQYFVDLYKKSAENLRMQLAGIVAPDKKPQRSLVL